MAVEGEKVLGTAALKDDAVYSVFVCPEIQGRGIETALMDYAENVAKKRGIRLLGVPATIFATPFYKKRGYRKFREERTPDYGRVIIMRKKLR